MTPAEQQIASIIGRAPERIAVIRALYLGDLLLAIPALRALRAGFPTAEITLISLPWAASFAERFAHYIDRFREFPGFPGIAEVPYDPHRTGHFLAEELQHRYDLVIQLHGSGATSNPFALALGGRLTAGFYEGVVPEGMTIATPYPRCLPEIERNLRLPAVLRCPADDRALEFPLTSEDQREAEALLAGLPVDAPLVGIHPGAKIPARRWPPKRFAEVADALASRGATVVITGGPDEEPVCHAVAATMQSEPLLLAGKTSLGGLAAVINRLDLFISNDTGPAHLAIACDTPSVVVFGPSEFRRWAPLDRERHRVVWRAVACRPCGQAVCPIDHRCLDWIEPEAVIDAATALLSTSVKTYRREAYACAG
jgi:ADP-heptose:LPS heptosyltransferase